MKRIPTAEPANTAGLKPAVILILEETAESSPMDERALQHEVMAWLKLCKSSVGFEILHKTGVEQRSEMMKI